MPQLSTQLNENLAALREKFGLSADFYSKTIELYGCKGAVVLFDGMASLESLWVLLLDAVSRRTPEAAPQDGRALFALLLHHSGLPAREQACGRFCRLDDAADGGHGGAAAGRLRAGHCVLGAGAQIPLGGGAQRGRQPAGLPGGLRRSFAGQSEPAAPSHPHRCAGAGGGAGGLPHADGICPVLLQR